MVALCFVAKSPNPVARVFGFRSSRVSTAALETEAEHLVEIFDRAMDQSMLQEGDAFYAASRAELLGNTWTWVGHYRHAFEEGGRAGGYAAGGILLPDKNCSGKVVAVVMELLKPFVEQAILDEGQIRKNWRSMDLSPELAKLSEDANAELTAAKRGQGLSADSDLLGYMSETDLSPMDLAFLFDALQTQQSLRRYGRLLFGPSPHFARKLVPKAGFERLEFGTETQAPAQKPLAEPSAPPSAPPPVPQPLPSRPLLQPAAASSQSSPEFGGIEGAVQKLTTEIEDTRATLEQRQRWLMIAVTAAFFVMVFAFGWVFSTAIATRNLVGDIQQAVNGRLQDLAGRLDGVDQRLKAPPPVAKPLVITPTAKPPPVGTNRHCGKKMTWSESQAACVRTVARDGDKGAKAAGTESGTPNTSGTGTIGTGAAPPNCRDLNKAPDERTEGLPDCPVVGSRHRNRVGK